MAALRCFLLFGLLSPLLVLAGPSQAQTLRWIDGVFEPSYTLNCAHGYSEVLTQSLIGYYGADDASFPRVGDTYYVRVLLGTVGAPCTGGAQVSVRVLFPLATMPVTGDPQRPIRCFSFPLGNPDQMAEYTDGSCPLSPTLVEPGVWQYNPTPSFGAAWPVATGQGLQIWFPVRSDAVLNGISSGDSARFFGRIWNIDGVNSPESFPRQWVFVAPAAVQPPQGVAIFGHSFEAGLSPRPDISLPTKSSAALFDSRMPVSTARHPATNDSPPGSLR